MKMSDLSLTGTCNGQIVSIPYGQLKNSLLQETTQAAINQVTSINTPSYTPSKVAGTYTQVVHSETIMTNVSSAGLDKTTSGNLIMVNNGTYSGDPPLNTIIPIGSNIAIGNNWDVIIATPAYTPSGPITTSSLPTISVVNQTGYPVNITIQLQDATTNGGVPTNVVYIGIPNGGTIVTFGTNTSNMYLLTSRIHMELYAYGETDGSLILVASVVNTYNPPYIPINLSMLESQIDTINNNISQSLSSLANTIEGNIGLLQSEVNGIISTTFRSYPPIIEPIGEFANTTVPDGATLMRVTMCGGGGGGGAAGVDIDTSTPINGGSGGGAGIIYQMVVRVEGGNILDYIIGAGGIGGVASSDGMGTAGGNGGSTGLQISPNMAIVAGGGGGGGSTTQPDPNDTFPSGFGGGGGAATTLKSISSIGESSGYQGLYHTPGVGSKSFPPLSGGSDTNTNVGSVSYPLVTGGSGAGYGSIYGYGGDAPGFGNAGYPTSNTSGGSLFSISSGLPYGGYGGIGGTLDNNSIGDGSNGGNGVIILEYDI